MLIMCRSVRQFQHIVHPLPTQQLWVPGGRELCLSGPSYLHTCMTCTLYIRGGRGGGLGVGGGDFASGVCPVPGKTIVCGI